MCQSLELYVAIAFEFIRLTVLDQTHILHLEVRKYLHHIALDETLGKVAHISDERWFRGHLTLPIAIPVTIAIVLEITAILPIIAIVPIMVSIVAIVIVSIITIELSVPLAGAIGHALRS